MVALGLEGTSILHTIEGELSPEIRSLVDEVTGSIGAAEVDERLISAIGEGGILRAATVTIDPVDGAGGQEYDVSGEMKADKTGGHMPTAEVKRVTFEGVNEVSYRATAGRQVSGGMMKADKTGGNMLAAEGVQGVKRVTFEEVSYGAAATGQED
jgi:hypothetical protein